METLDSFFYSIKWFASFRDYWICIPINLGNIQSGRWGMTWNAPVLDECLDVWYRGCCGWAPWDHWVWGWCRWRGVTLRGSWFFWSIQSISEKVYKEKQLYSKNKKLAVLHSPGRFMTQPVHWPHCLLEGFLAWKLPSYVPYRYEKNHKKYKAFIGTLASRSDGGFCQHAHLNTQLDYSCRLYGFN